MKGNWKGGSEVGQIICANFFVGEGEETAPGWGARFIHIALLAASFTMNNATMTMGRSRKVQPRGKQNRDE